METVHPALPRNVWPAVPGPAAARLLALLFQLERSQWLAPERLAAAQRRQLGAVVDHARRTVPFYRERLAALARPDGPDPARWREVPLLTRAEVQGAGQGLASTAPPPEHGATHTQQTSGSTGRPLRTLGTGLTRLFWNALALREHLWHGRDFSRRLCAIRPEAVDTAPDGADAPDWGAPVATVFASGPASLLGSHHPAPHQAAWLAARAPGYLLTLPSNLRELARHCLEAGEALAGLHQVRTFGETVGDDLRDLALRAWGVPLVDAYSAQEVGYMALQCPGHAHYHVQSEALLVEVVDDAGRPCGPGETGQVVVTTLHNFAMPLIRYANGDYAEVGGPCPCGRGLPVLRRILGRSRNLLTLPDGRRFFPSFPAELFTAVADVRQFQLVQHGPAELEVRLVVPGGLAADQREAIARRLADRFGHPFHFRFTLVDAIPRSAGHKYEDFVSRLVP